MAQMPEMRELLRGLKSLPGPYERFDPAQAYERPQDLFAEWLLAAVEAGIREPHAMTLSTVDEHGFPDARVLILKNVDKHGWHFAITRSSAKGRQIAHSPHVALTFYWPALGRQVRIRGVARDMGPEAQAADFLARPAGSRAAGLLGRQSEVLASDDELDRALAQQRRRLDEAPGLVAPQWAVYAVWPSAIEFWQADEQRRHVRLRYVPGADGWSTERLWP